MREFKFRAWHSEDKVMIYDLNTLKLFHGVLHPNDYILMQYSGIKDERGTEIYEGDILKLTGTPPFCDWIGEVKFGEFKHYTNLGYNEGETTVCGWHIRAPKINLSEALNDGWEVIGNIYENPELIEGKE